ncbi:MAG: pyrroloquinoline quinone biosynthesis protein PqqE [Nevskiaceae bacterium]|nr:MAG: pyrroloquinoline quinone biosynthesis protein PqqE [Nevskiaceae bacterium]TBR73901.1 MAG: pyrroloquinoline quinone biosynthesis protein PqqE [Nevskiaceae bacterium]
MTPKDAAIGPPMSVMFELTHRCPLQCPYCSNPLELERASAELETHTLVRVLDECASFGVLQVHFSGGEPLSRSDLPEIVAHAHGRGLYTNIDTSGVMLDDTALAALQQAGIDHLQISFQDVDEAGCNRVANFPNAFQLKLAAARRVSAAGLPLTLNFVVYHDNIARVPQMIELGLELGAQRIEIANVQYYGWGLINRSRLLPTREELQHATATVEAARVRLKGRLRIDYVVPDYYAQRPKACMGGWAQRLINISPSGKALPCHAAETLPGFTFWNVRDHSLEDIWYHSEAFLRFRGTAWMPEPCRSCERREIDWGGCRCQAFALTGDAARTDPACVLAPDHAVMQAAVAEMDGTQPFVYRGFHNVEKVLKLKNLPTV